MQKAICFGAAGGAIRLYQEIKEKYNVIAFTDNDSKKWGRNLYGINIYPPDMCKKINYEVIIITSAPGLQSIYNQLLEMGVAENKIIASYITAPLESRRIFLEKLSYMQKVLDKEAGVAEAGVFEGDFAKYINEYYSDRNLFLFDTFEGFSEKDIKKERQFSKAETGDYSNTSIDQVMKKMPYPEYVKIYKGYFPESAAGIEHKFCFVNLDLDLYEPTYAGLHFFSDKMISGGVILVHDYFAENFKGPREAVDKFIAERNKYSIYPIGDGISVMICGF